MKIKIVLVMAAVLLLTGCDTLRKIGGGINGAASGGGKGALCIVVGKLPCIVGGALVGYANGVENRRDEIRGEHKDDRSDRIENAVLKDKGLDVSKPCGLLGYNCWFSAD